MPLLSLHHQRQQHEADCLVACAAMILAYLQIPIRYERLYRLLRAQPFGTPFHNIEFLKSLNLSVVVEDGKLDKLHNYLELGLPILASIDTRDLPYWSGESTDHVVVVAGLDETKKLVYLHDPFFPTGPVSVPVHKFELAWLEKAYLSAVISLTAVE